MKKVSKQHICHKLCSFLPIILVLVLFSFFLFFSVSESTPSLLTTLIALLSTMFLVTLTRKKWSPDKNLVQDNLQKLESQPSVGDDVIHTEVTKENDTVKRHEQQAEAKPDTSLPLDSESCNYSSMDRSLEVNAQKKYEQHADPHSDSSLPSDSESSTSSIRSESLENDHKRNQSLGLSDSLAFDNDVDGDVEEEEEEEDSLIEIKLPNSHFFGLIEDEEPKQKLESNLPEFLPESIFKQQGLMELLEEINEINEDENLIEIDISMGSSKCQDLTAKQELKYYGDQCVLSD